MQKIFVFLTVLFSGVAVLSSCDKQEEAQINNSKVDLAEKQAMNELILNLENYNKNYLTTEGHGQTRSLWGWLRRLARTAYADAAGGLVGASCGPWGALSGAAISSAIVFMAEDGYSVHPSLAPNVTRGDGLGDFGGNPEGPEIYCMNADALNYTVISSNNGLWTDSVGFYHNSILMDLNENEMLNNSNNFYLNLMISNICLQAENMSGNGRGTTTDFQLLTAINYSQLKSVLEDDSYFDSYDDFVDEIIAIYPEYESELDFLKSYIEALCEINQSQNYGTYAQGVLTLINNSNVSNAAKQRLGDAVIAGNASARLWNFE